MAKRLQSVKYSFLQYRHEEKIQKKIRNYFLKFCSKLFWSPVPKNMKRVPLGVFERPFFCKIENIGGGPFGDNERTCEKKPQKVERPCTKQFLVKGGTGCHVLLPDRPQKTLINLYDKCQWK